MFEKILIANDGSETSMRALEAGMEIARLFKSTVIIVYAAYVPLMYTGDIRPEIKDALRDDGRKILENANRLVKDAGIECETKLLFDEKPADGILRVAEEGNLDLIVIGSRGLDATTRKALGSTSIRVIEEAHKATLVVY